MAKMVKAATVDEYIKSYPAKVQASLQKMRKTIKTVAPKAEEVISYGIPGYKYHGMLIFFAAWKDHISVYPAPRNHASFKKDLAEYRGGKGTVQFPLDKPIPFELIKRMVQFRVKANEEQLAAKNKKMDKPTAVKKKAEKPTDEQQVAAYMKNLSQLKPETGALRSIIKSASKKLSERIKWNAPSYYYKEDILTFGPYRNGKILLVFHHPAIVKVKSELLEGDYKDRRLAYFSDMKAIKSGKKELTKIIREVITHIDKK